MLLESTLQKLQLSSNYSFLLNFLIPRPTPIAIKTANPPSIGVRGGGGIPGGAGSPTKADIAITLLGIDTNNINNNTIKYFFNINFPFSKDINV